MESIQLLDRELFRLNTCLEYNQFSMLERELTICLDRWEAADIRIQFTACRTVEMALVHLKWGHFNNLKALFRRMLLRLVGVLPEPVFSNGWFSGARPFPWIG